MIGGVGGIYGGLGALAGGAFGAPAYGGPAFGAGLFAPPPGRGKGKRGLVIPGGNAGGLPKIKKIEKLYNCVIYEKFINEFKRMIKKYPQKQVGDIMKHLFHGSNQTDPKLIYQSEDGLDIRFSNAGAYGNGIYFANNSAYSHSFTHRGRNGECQMFMCLVLIGDSVQ